MADANSLLARFRAARSTARMIDPVTGEPRDVAVDPAFASTFRSDTLWVPIVRNIGSVVGTLLTLRDEERVAVDEAIRDMVADCAVQAIDDALVHHVLQHIADRGLTLVADTRR